MPKLKVNNKEIYYSEYGSGQSLLLIAGLGSDSVSWLPVIIGLSQHFHLVTFDNRGVGRSSPDNNDITIADMADDCANLIIQLKLTKVNVLGHSMGGMIAMELASRYPEMINSLILAASAPLINERNSWMFKDWVYFLKSGMDKRRWFRNMFYWIFSKEIFENKQLLEQTVELAVSYRFQQTDQSFENQTKAISQFNALDILNTIKTKSLIIYGDQDILFPIEETKILFTGLQNKIEISIFGAAHSIHVDKPVEFIKSVVDFFAPNSSK
jgi:pimeloyl-ACP methyl ester carboxylesterase